MIKEKNAILFSHIDTEDAWVSGGISFIVENTATYVGAYDEVKCRLEASDMVEHIIEDRCLLYDLFENDDTYKFVKTYFKYGLYYVFENSDGNQVEYRMSCDFITIII